MSIKIGSLWYHSTTALHIAASLEDCRNLEYILKDGLFSDIKCTTTCGETALLVASYTGCSKKVSLLLSHNADNTIFASTFHKKSVVPLHAAASLGYENVISALINQRGDTQMKTSLNLTPALRAGKGPI